MGWSCASSLHGICWSSLFTDIANVTGFIWICFKNQMPLDLFIPYFKDSFSASYDRWFPVGLLCEGFWHFACLFISVLMVLELLWALLDLVELHCGFSHQAEAELQKSYFEPLVKKEQMEEKMRNIREVKCQVVTCRTVRARLWPLSVWGQVGRILWMWGCGAVSCNVI